MFEFKNKNHFMNTCCKFLKESYYIYNSELIAKLILDLASKVWRFCDKFDYMDYCREYKLYPATNKLSMDIMCAKTDEDFKIILSRTNIYFRDPKYNEEFKTYGNVGSINFLREKYGVYKLFDDNKKLIYIGKSVNLGERIVGSLKEKRCLLFSYALLNNKSDINIYEAYYISKYKPKDNSEGKYNDEVSIELPELKFSEIFDLRDFVKDVDLISEKVKYE